MNRRIPLGVFIALATGCASNGIQAKLTTGGAGGTAGTGTTGGASSGAAASGTNGGSGSSGDGGPHAIVGEACSPGGVMDTCATGGLICDVVSSTCRLPQIGEECSADAGCATLPANLGCYSAAVSGVPESVCLVPCSPTDSSGCPYGTSCGDPNLLGFCSAEGTPDCTPWGTCSLGGGVSGTCVPSGTHTTCFAYGTESTPYAPCDPFALNSDAAHLCSPGMACLSIPLTLGGAPGAGFCFPLCGGGDGGALGASCVEDGGHCDQPAESIYGVCRPGSPCQFGDFQQCAAEEVCVPDDPNSLSGGCLPYAPDAGGLGSVCTPPTAVPEASSCSFYGVCLPADGGFDCTPLCNLADGGEPYCHTGLCTALAPDMQTDVIGACR